MVRKQLKIAIYSGEIPSTTFIERLIIGLAKNDCEIFLFGVQNKKVSYVPNIKVIAYTHNRFIKFIHLFKYGILLTLFKNKDKKKLDSLLHSHSKNPMYSRVKNYPVLWYRPDIFHLQWAKGIEEWAWVQEFGIKLVVSFLGTHINYSPITIPEIGVTYKRYFPNVDGFHAVSNAIALKGEQYNASKYKIKVVYSGFNMDLFNNSSKKNKNDVFKIISIGREHWVKGYTYAIDACIKLKDQDFKFEYSIIGGASDLELKYQIQDLDLHSEVKLKPRMPFIIIQQHISEADLLLLPSVEEGIANVVLEAMASKTIVLSTDCGGMVEVIDDGKNGFLTPVRKPTQMAERIIEISKLTETKKSEIVEEAFKTVGAQHNEAKMIKNMLELYQQL